MGILMRFLLCWMLWSVPAQAATVTVTLSDADVKRLVNFACRLGCPDGTVEERIERLRQQLASDSRITVTWDKEEVQP